MEVSMFRSSSLNQWDYCQMSYYITYNLGYQQPSQKKANLGTIVHKTLEILANCKLILQQGSKGPKFDLLDQELAEPVSFTKKSLNTQKFVDDILDKCYDYYTSNTPHISYDRAVDFPFCEQMVQECLNINNGQFDPRKMTILKPEQNFDMEIKEPWANGLRIRGTMDLLTLHDEQTIEYVDYKTGARKDWATGETKDLKKLQVDLQLLLYYYAIKQLYPTYKNIIMSIFFLRDGGPFSLCYDKQDEDYFMSRLKQRYEEIKQCKLPKPINPWRSDFRCQKLCHYYKTNWPGTNDNMCMHVEKQIKTYGIGIASDMLKKDDFKLGHYQAPGSVK